MRHLYLILLTSWMTNCGSASFDEDSKIFFEIYGVFKKPAAATGNASPRSLSLKLESVALINTDGTDTVLESDFTEDLSIISRPWIVYEKDLVDYIGTTFSGFKATFDTTATATGRFRIDDIELSAADYTLTEAIEVEKSQSFTVTLKINWLHTATVDETAQTETFEEPEFELSLTNGTVTTTVE